MSGIEDVTRLIRSRRGGLCDAGIAADLALPSRRVHRAAAMFGKTSGFQRVHNHCPRCATLIWITRKTA